MIPVVGQTMWLAYTEPRDQGQEHAVVVTKVGRKWAEIHRTDRPVQYQGHGMTTTQRRNVHPACPACRRLLKPVVVDGAAVTVKRPCKNCGRKWSLTLTPTRAGIEQHWLNHRSETST